ncbi:MAG TPA: hypothetical protein VFO42_05385 [Sphingomicrobium sp.]|nr:hypothetical protein [Sphingomicrobium sp.]
MAGRLAWIIAGGAAVVGGMAIQDGDFFSFKDERHVDREIDEAIDEATEVRRDSARIVVAGRAGSDDAAVAAMTDAVGNLVKAEAALAAAQIGPNTDPEEVQVARARRDEARGEVERLKAEMAARDGSLAARDAVREQVRREVREAVRNN